MRTFQSDCFPSCLIIFLVHSTFDNKDLVVRLGGVYSNRQCQQGKESCCFIAVDRGDLTISCKSTSRISCAAAQLNHEGLSRGLAAKRRLGRLRPHPRPGRSKLPPPQPLATLKNAARPAPPSPCWLGGSPGFASGSRSACGPNPGAATPPGRWPAVRWPGHRDLRSNAPPHRRSHC